MCKSLFLFIIRHNYKNKNFKQTYLQGLHNLNWKTYYSWDIVIKKFENISKNNPKIIHSGPLSFKDDDIEINKKIDFSKSIAVFLHSPYKKIFSIRFARFSAEYRSTENMINFLKEIYNLSEKLNLNLVLKQKKSDKMQISKFYFSKIKKILENKNVYLMDENVSPKKYIDKCLCAISFPFSSTAFLINNYQKSIFYDPTGQIFTDDKGSSGLKIINNSKDLEYYILSNIE